MRLNWKWLDNVEKSWFPYLYSYYTFSLYLYLTLSFDSTNFLKTNSVQTSYLFSWNPCISSQCFLINSARTQHTKLAKGRTNIELREQFILADGVSQSMTAFRSKPSPTSTLQRSQLSSAGPITKVRMLKWSSHLIPQVWFHTVILPL